MAFDSHTTVPLDGAAIAIFETGLTENKWLGQISFAVSSCAQLSSPGSNDGDGSLLVHALIAAVKPMLNAVQSAGRGTLYQFPDPGTAVISTGSRLCKQCSAFAEQS